MKKSIILILFAVFVMVMGSFASVSAQDVDNMSNEQLTTLLLQIMQRLDGSGEAAETPEPTATPTPEPTKTPQPELSDDKAELEALMIAIMQKLQQEEPGNASEKSAGVPIPAGDPGEEAENSIWEDKKLIIEALPGYMFIQPTKEPISEPVPDNNSRDNSGGKDPVPSYEPTPVCPYPRTWGCDIHGNCACGLG